MYVVECCCLVSLFFRIAPASHRAAFLSVVGALSFTRRSLYNTTPSVTNTTIVMLVAFPTPFTLPSNRPHSRLLVNYGRRRGQMTSPRHTPYNHPDWPPERPLPFNDAPPPYSVSADDVSRQDPSSIKPSEPNSLIPRAPPGRPGSLRSVASAATAPVASSRLRRFPTAFSIYEEAHTRHTQYVVGTHRRLVTHCFSFSDYDNCVWSSQAIVTLRNGLRSDSPLLATTYLARGTFNITAYEPVLQRSIASPTLVQVPHWGGLRPNSYKFDVLVGSGVSQKCETFEWRHSNGLAVRSLRERNTG